MRHIEHGNAQFILEFFYPWKNLTLACKIQRCQWLIHQQDLRPKAERPRNGAALAFAARELRYAAGKKMTNPEEFNRFGKPLFAIRHFRSLKAKRQILFN